MSFIHPITQKNIPDSLVGIIAPMFTPVDSEKRIDQHKLREYTKWLVNDPNITALFWRSGVGRMFTFSTKEVKDGLDVILEAADGKKPVFCGTAGEYNGDFSTKADPQCYLDQSIELSLYAQKSGAEGVVLVMPAALPVDSGSTPDETSFEYFKSVHDQTDGPILVYNPQNMADGFHATPSLISKVSALPRVIGMKLSTTDMYKMSKLIDAAGQNDFAMIAGSECTYYQALATGASGIVGQGCSIYPNILRKILDSFVAGDWASALQAQVDVNRALDGFQDIAADMSGFAYLKKAGMETSPYCRDGSKPLPQDTVDQIYNAIKPYCDKY
jgi:dihydrodipicolinate synthase/N-acetylneuraminate lyase